MARPLRIELAGGLYHVTSRGDGREDIYRSDADRSAWVDLFGEVCGRFNWVCHAWCQMTNHYHIVVETIEGNLSSGMRHLNGVYTQMFNRMHGRVGHVFQGRYKAILVEKDAHLLELSTYVVLNPVRARMVSEPSAWPWSSFSAMVATLPPPAWLHVDWILGQFAVTRGRAVRAWIDYVGEGMAAATVWNGLRGQIYLGGERFVEGVRHLPEDPCFEEVPRAQRRPLSVPLDHYRSAHSSRDVAMAAAYASGDYSMKRIAEFFDVHYATVSRAVRRMRDQ